MEEEQKDTLEKEDLAKDSPEKITLDINANEKIGDYLKRVREFRELSVEHLAKSIYLSKNVLLAIEENHWSYFPTEAYLRSYISSICEKLEIDKAQVLKRFSEEINSRFKITQVNLPTETEFYKKNTTAPKVFIVVIFIIIVALFIANNFLRNSSLSDLEEPVAKPKAENISEPKLENATDSTNTQDSALATANALAAQEAAANEATQDTSIRDTLRFECSHSATDNTCGIKISSDTKMGYFTRVANRYLNRYDTLQLTITVPERTKMFMNNTEIKYGRFNTILFYNGEIVKKFNRELR